MTDLYHIQYTSKLYGKEWAIYNNQGANILKKLNIFYYDSFFFFLGTIVAFFPFIRDYCTCIYIYELIAGFKSSLNGLHETLSLLFTVRGHCTDWGPSSSLLIIQPTTPEVVSFLALETNLVSLEKKRELNSWGNIIILAQVLNQK